MTALTELFPTATVEQTDLDQLNSLEFGTDEYGATKFRIILNFMMHSMQHYMAVQAQEVIEEDAATRDWNDMLVEPGQLYIAASMDLYKLDQDAAKGIVEGIDQILPMITNQLKSNPFTSTSQDGTLIAININNVLDTLEAA